MTFLECCFNLYDSLNVQETKILIFVRNSFLTRDAIRHFANRGCLRSHSCMVSYMEEYAVCSVFVHPLPEILNTKKHMYLITHT